MKPLHVGIILDGNRRFAKRLLLEPWKGHEYGAEKLEKLFDWAKELGIKELTLYAFSLENFNREKKEFDYLMGIFKKEIRRLLDDERLDRDRIKVRFIGETERFDAELQDLMKKVMKKTEKNENYLLNFAMAYGGRQELIFAIKKLVKSNEEVSEENLKKNLWLKSEPDLIIRTGGEKRTSNFLPWQAVYSEWIFLEKMWPELKKEDFQNCISEFESRERRFGR